MNLNNANEVNNIVEVSRLSNGGVATSADYLVLIKQAPQLVFDFRTASIPAEWHELLEYSRLGVKMKDISRIQTLCDLPISFHINKRFKGMVDVGVESVIKQFNDDGIQGELEIYFFQGNSLSNYNLVAMANKGKLVREQGSFVEADSEGTTTPAQLQLQLSCHYKTFDELEANTAIKILQLVMK